MLICLIQVLCGMMKQFIQTKDTDYTFTVDMNDELVEINTSGSFYQGRGIFKVKYYNPPEIIFQHLPVKKRVNKKEVNRNRNSYFIDNLTSVDIKDAIRNGGKIIEINEGII